MSRDAFLAGVRRTLVGTGAARLVLDKDRTSDTIIVSPTPTPGEIEVCVSFI
jgi:hypothetical protein